VVLTAESKHPYRALTGITDENGKFTLTCMYKQQSGACVGLHKVVIADHMPGKFRGEREDRQVEQANYLANLKNRPIPERYTILAKTPLEVEIKSDQQEYVLKLTR